MGYPALQVEPSRAAQRSLDSFNQR